MLWLVLVRPEKWKEIRTLPKNTVAYSDTLIDTHRWANTNTKALGKKKFLFFITWKCVEVSSRQKSETFNIFLWESQAKTSYISLKLPNCALLLELLFISGVPSILLNYLSLRNNFNNFQVSVVYSLKAVVNKYWQVGILHSWLMLMRFQMFLAE